MYGEEAEVVAAVTMTRTHSFAEQEGGMRGIRAAAA